jgi:hypothetical protein
VAGPPRRDQHHRFAPLRHERRLRPIHRLREPVTHRNRGITFPVVPVVMGKVGFGLHNVTARVDLDHPVVKLMGDPNRNRPVARRQRGAGSSCACIRYPLWQKARPESFSIGQPSWHGERRVRSYLALRSTHLGAP